MIEREQYLKKIRPFINKDLVKVLTGVRRSGKSVMLKLIQEELLRQGVNKQQFIEFNFEDMRHADILSASALHDKVSEFILDNNDKVYLFFDEIQEVKDWEKAINSFRVEFDCDIYITGSNAKLLSSELASYLSGRYVEFVIYPFSLEEFAMSYNKLFPNSSPNDIFKQYLTMGGMPYLSNLQFDVEPSKMYLKDLYSALVLKDVVKRNNIRDVDLLERIIAYVTTNIGTTFSATNISKYFKNEGRVVSPETVLNYIRACESAYLFYRVKREDIQGKKILSVNEKYYLVDQGLREAVFGGNRKDINLMFENIVYVELLRRGYTITVGKNGTKEIDFIARKQSEKIYIQVAYLLASEEVVEHEFSVLESISDNHPKYVISYDEFDMSRNGIIHQNIVDFLLC
ncbi:ATP-binding protein [Tannockella kyphosi]|uniref:ATP-binding protein n=1 Tax=Tannockella kyphosi TaxID=2899121 RepID=UPI002011C716|nr:ATP-binding protein [Tannockella kyphosi]